MNEFNEILGEIRLLKQEIALLKEAVNTQKIRQQVLGDFITEKEAEEITGLSRGTLAKLRNDGYISRSSIGGKSNFYRADSFRKLLERREKEN